MHTGIQKKDGKKFIQGHKTNKTSIILRGQSLTTSGKVRACSSLCNLGHKCKNTYKKKDKLL